MRETLNVFEQSLLLWQNFEEKHCSIEEWLEEKEKECENVLRYDEDGSETDSETGHDHDRETQLQACKVSAFVDIFTQLRCLIYILKHLIGIYPLFI